MTGDFNVKSIAVIGAGYSGLSTLADLIHTSSSGHSTISSQMLPESPAFTTVKLFETNSRVGGVWNYSSVPDPGLPSKEILEKEYWKPEKNVVYQKNPNDTKQEFTWSHSAVYDDMYTNVSSDFMTLSTQKKRVYPHRQFSPFITQKEVLGILLDFVDQYQLDQYINYNSSVQNVSKDARGKYELTIKHTDPITGEVNWKVEAFDAIVAASGRFQYPNFPKIPNLLDFNIKRPGVITHAKTFRKATDFTDKRIVIVGASVSTVGVLEFLKPLAKEIYVSRRKTRYDKFPSDFKGYYDSALSNVIEVGEIINLDGDNNEISFTTGEVLKDIDNVIFATGFNIHYPYLTDLTNKHEHIIKIDKTNGGQTGLVRNLFHYTFNIKEPTLAVVGLQGSGFFVLAAESQGAAIAGVWSNAKSLPSIDEQKKWIDDRYELTKNLRTPQEYTPESAKEEIEYLNREFAPFDRPDVSLRANVELFKEQRDQLEVVYKRFASGELKEDYVAKNDTSN